MKPHHYLTITLLALIVLLGTTVNNTGMFVVLLTIAVTSIPVIQGFLTPSKPIEDKPQSTPVKPVRISNQFMTAEEKREYLKSMEWAELKITRLILSNDQCEVPNCTNTTELHLHHVTYTRLGNEKINDVRIVCQDCHQAIHNKLGYDRTTNYPIGD